MENIYAHHKDYDKPLDVVWLCAHHHALYHALLTVRENMEGQDG